MSLKRTRNRKCKKDLYKYERKKIISAQIVTHNR